MNPLPSTHVQVIHADGLHIVGVFVAVGDVVDVTVEVTAPVQPHPLPLLGLPLPTPAPPTAAAAASASRLRGAILESRLLVLYLLDVCLQICREGIVGYRPVSKVT